MTAYDDTNIFARILRGELPCEKVYEDEHVLAFMDIMPRVGNIEFVPVGPELNDGSVYLQEWVQTAVTSTGKRVPMTRGTSVRRYRDGSTVYAADYFDIATLTRPEVLAASNDCGSTITTDDIMRYRLRGL